MKIENCSVNIFIQISYIIYLWGEVFFRKWENLESVTVRSAETVVTKLTKDQVTAFNINQNEEKNIIIDANNFEKWPSKR